MQHRRERKKDGDRVRKKRRGWSADLGCLQLGKHFHRTTLARHSDEARTGNCSRSTARDSSRRRSRGASICTTVRAYLAFKNTVRGGSCHATAWPTNRVAPSRRARDRTPTRLDLEQCRSTREILCALIAPFLLCFLRGFHPSRFERAGSYMKVHN